MLGVFLSPHDATDRYVTSRMRSRRRRIELALARARLTLGAATASLDGLQVP